MCAWSIVSKIEIGYLVVSLICTTILYCGIRRGADDLND